MNEEKRKLGDYEIIQSIYIGDKEVVFGVDGRRRRASFITYGNISTGRKPQNF